MKIIDIIQRLFLFFNVRTNKELSEKLGVSGTVLSNWKHRNTIDYDILFTKCENINTNWLLYGEGLMLKSESDQYFYKSEEKQKECERCKDKDRIIELLEQNVKLQNKLLQEQDKNKPRIENKPTENKPLVKQST